MGINKQRVETASNPIYFMVWSVCLLDTALVVTLQLPDNMPVTLPMVSSNSSSVQTFQTSEGVGTQAATAVETTVEQSSPTYGGKVTVFPKPTEESVVKLTTSQLRDENLETTSRRRNQSSNETSTDLSSVGNKKKRKRKEKWRKKKRKTGRINAGKRTGRQSAALNTTSLQVRPLEGNFTNGEERETTLLPLIVAATSSTKDDTFVSVAQTLIANEVVTSKPQTTQSSPPTQQDVTQAPEGVPWGERWMWYLGELWNLPVLLLIFAATAAIILGGCLCVLCCCVTSTGKQKKRKFHLPQRHHAVNIEHPHFGSSSYRRVSTNDGNTMTSATTTTGYDLGVHTTANYNQPRDSLEWETTSETESKSDESDFDRDYDSVEGASVCDEDPAVSGSWYEDAVPHNMNHAVSRLEPCSPNTFWQKSYPAFSTFASRGGPRSAPAQ